MSPRTLAKRRALGAAVGLLLAVVSAHPAAARTTPSTKPLAHKAKVAPAQPLATIPAAWKKALDSVTPDRPDTVNATHYITSNENRHERFRDELVARGPGGVYLGIGADQNYLLVGWSRPELAVMTDFDSWVVAIHAVYVAFFAAAKSPYRFYELWTPGNRDKGRAAIRAYYSDKAERQKVLDTFDHSRKTVAPRIAWLRQHLRTHRVPSVFTHQADYEHVQNLARARRIHAVVADMTGSSALSELGKRLHELKLTVRTQFLSNAEYYFKYGKQFRDNIAGLPVDASSLVLRTRSLGAGKYEYYSQTAHNFRTFLSDPKVAGVLDVVSRRVPGKGALRYRIVAKPSDPPVQIPKRPQRVP